MIEEMSGKKRSSLQFRILTARKDKSRIQNLPYFNPMGRCYMWGSRRLIGCHDLLKSVVWPHYTRPRGSSEISRGTRGSGMQRGKVVDTELFLLYHKASIGVLNPYTSKILKLLKKLKWTVLDTQRVVAHPYYRAGTAVDMVVRDKAGSTIFVEIKCGFHGVWETPVGNITLGDMDDIPNSAKYHALIQAAYGMWLGSFVSPRPDKGAVVRVHDEGVSVHDVPEYLTKPSTHATFESMCEFHCQPSKAWKKANPTKTP